VTAADLEVGGLEWWLSPGGAPELAEPLIARALAALAAGAPDLKRGRRKGNYRLDLSGSGTPDHLLKVNRYAGTRRVGSKSSKARHELAIATALATLGLPAPLPIAAGERRENGRLEACYLLVPLLADVTDLREELALPEPRPARRRAVAQAFGALARNLHDAGLHQDDFQPNNFLVRWHGDSPELFVIDFERARLLRRVPRRLRHRALAKLDRELGRAPSTLRMRFLRAYAGGDSAAARAHWRALEAQAPALASRDARHLFRNATVPGRRYEAVRLPDWSGLTLPGLDPGRLERAAARAVAAQEPIHGTSADSEWTVRLERTSVRAGRRVLARALVLAARGLAPRPLALLCGREASVLILERGAQTVQAHEVRHNASLEAAWHVLGRRLEAYGRLTRALAEADIAVAPAGPGRVQAVLLAVEVFEPRRRFGGPGARAGRAR